VLYERVFLFRSWRDALAHRWRLYACLALTWIVLLVVMAPGPRATSVGFHLSTSVWVYALNQAAMIARYLRLVIWPQSLVVDYGPPVPLRLTDVLPQAILVVSLGIATVAAFWWKPAVAFAGAWVFITLAPTSSFVPIITEVGAERRMYVPLMSLATVFAAALAILLKRHAPARSHAVATFAIAASLGTVTLARNRDYASELTLAEVTLRHWPTDVSHGTLGSALSHVHRDEDAIRELRIGARSDPRSRYNLGLALYNVRRFDEAIPELQRFASEHPTLELVPSARRVLGDAYSIQRDWAHAIVEYRLALSMIPNDPATRRKLVSAMGNQGLAFADAGRFTDAVQMFEAVLQENPGDSTTRHNLAAALLDGHDPSAAEREARKAIETDPTDAGSYDLLGRALAIQGHFDEALREFREALKLAPGDEEIQEDLRRVLAVKQR
jgi:tetratricopeptide (TPR) repeat protein